MKTFEQIQDEIAQKHGKINGAEVGDIENAIRFALMEYEDVRNEKDLASDLLRVAGDRDGWANRYLLEVDASEAIIQERDALKAEIELLKKDVQREVEMCDHMIKERTPIDDAEVREFVLVSLQRHTLLNKKEREECADQILTAFAPMVAKREELADCLAHAEAELVQLRFAAQGYQHAAEEGMADKRRLDWLENEAYLFRPDEDGYVVVRGYDGEPFKEPSVRAAVDAAMAPAEPPVAGEGGVVA